MNYDDLKTELIDFMEGVPDDDIHTRVSVVNELREIIHSLSPFKTEPVDFVRWIKNDTVVANDYNPNTVAPPEMELLKLSILSDGYTQPIVTWDNGENIEVVDGFHRNRVGKECEDVQKRIQGYLPVVGIKDSQTGKNDRVASTIRHNRARGKHQIDAMSDIVIELKNRNWTNKRIGRELGMDEDEILRLCQITGMEELFKDSDFSRSWNIEDANEDFEEFTDEVTEEERAEHNFRTVNTSDKNRVFHTFDKWECHKAGFYATSKEGMTKRECEEEYAKLLTNEKQFRDALKGVISEWKHSCEHYLTNPAMNRVAWLGQASLAYAKQIPATFRSGWNLLSERQQEKANKIALEYLNKWLVKNGMGEVDMDMGTAKGRQAEIY